jgi:hypothetical protein
VGAGFSVCRFDNLSRSAFVFIFTSRGLALGCHCFTPASEESDAPDQLQSLGGTTQEHGSSGCPLAYLEQGIPMKFSTGGMIFHKSGMTTRLTLLPTLLVSAYQYLILPRS